VSALFATDEPNAAIRERPSAEVVRLLESFGYRAEAVRLWTPEHANTVLHACKKEQAIALRRAEGVAREQDGSVARGQPSWVERQDAAACIEQAQGEGIDELAQRVAYSIYTLHDHELKRLASHLIRLYRASPDQQPQQDLEPEADAPEGNTAMTDFDRFLEQLRERGLSVGPGRQPGDLELSGPVTERTPEIMAALRTFRPQLVERFGRREVAALGPAEVTVGEADPEDESCPVCSRTIVPDLKPRLVDPAYCDRGKDPRCPYKPGC
jgi:hypothetical protein